MTPKANPEIYDENSVFNRLFAEKPQDPKPNPANRIERVFAEVEAPVEVINVADFLPSY